MSRTTRHSRALPHPSTSDSASAALSAASGTKEPLSLFPFQLTDEMYAAIIRAPEAHGYPTLPSGRSQQPRFGHIFVEVSSQREKPPLVPLRVPSAESHHWLGLPPYSCARRAHVALGSSMAWTGCHPPVPMRLAAHSLTVRQSSCGTTAPVAPKARWPSRPLSPSCSFSATSTKRLLARSSTATPTRACLAADAWLRTCGLECTHGSRLQR